MSKASRGYQANECAVRANEQMDERVTQYLRPGSWLFCPIVRDKENSQKEDVVTRGRW